MPRHNQHVIDSFTKETIDKDTGEIIDLNETPTNQTALKTKLVKYMYVIRKYLDKIDNQLYLHTLEKLALDKEKIAITERSDQLIDHHKHTINQLTNHCKHLMDNLELKHFNIPDIGSLGNYISKRPKLDYPDFDRNISTHEIQELIRNYPDCFTTSVKPVHLKIKEQLKNKNIEMGRFFKLTDKEISFKFRE